MLRTSALGPESSSESRQSVDRAMQKTLRIRLTYGVGKARKMAASDSNRSVSLDVLLRGAGPTIGTRSLDAELSWKPTLALLVTRPSTIGSRTPGWMRHVELSMMVCVDIAIALIDWSRLSWLSLGRTRVARRLGVRKWPWRWTVRLDMLLRALLAIERTLSSRHRLSDARFVVSRPIERSALVRSRSPAAAIVGTERRIARQGAVSVDARLMSAQLSWWRASEVKALDVRLETRLKRRRMRRSWVRVRTWRQTIALALPRWGRRRLVPYRIVALLSPGERLHLALLLHPIDVTVLIPRLTCIAMAHSVIGAVLMRWQRARLSLLTNRSGSRVGVAALAVVLVRRALTRSLAGRSALERCVHDDVRMLVDMRRLLRVASGFVDGTIDVVGLTLMLESMARRRHLRLWRVSIPGSHALLEMQRRCRQRIRSCLVKR